MPPKKKSQSVFLGRETEVPREDVDSTLPSIEGDSSHTLLFSPALNSDQQQLEKESLVSQSPRSPESSVEGSPEPATSNAEPQGDEPPKPKTTKAKLKKLPQQGTRRSARITTVEPKVIQKTQPKAKPGRPVSRKAAGARKSQPTGQVYEVEKIVNHYMDPKTNVHEYRVSWKGYGAKHDTWESKKDLTNCREAIEAYEKGMKKTTK